MSTLEAAAQKSADPTWSPTSWAARRMDQAIPYPNPEAVWNVVGRLAKLPPLVTSWEVESLRAQLAEVAEGRRFVLQGGDCAEMLSECTSEVITNKLKILLQMSLVLTDGLKKPIIRIGRIAGQYAKPRTSPMETQNGVTLPSYYGDLINGNDFTPESRAPNPERLLLAYHHAAMTLNFIRALVDGGFADLHHPEYWDLNFLDKAGLTPELRSHYMRRVDALSNAIEVMEIIAGRPVDKVTSVEFFVSHEGLSLPYECALTRTVPRRSGYYNLGSHFSWIGERTRALDGAHVEYYRGIRNPIGIKLGPKTTPDDIQKLVELIDPAKEPGRLVLIGRFGAAKVREVLPGLVNAVRSTGRKPVWICDPMHGNTISTASGKKTRRVDTVLDELMHHIDVHEQEGSILGGVHFELTAENVTECVGGASGVREDDLDNFYQTLCDPRLNYEQAMEMAFAIARRMEAV